MTAITSSGFPKPRKLILNRIRLTRLVTFRTSKLELQESSSFSNLSYFEPNKLVLQCNVNGAMDKIVEYYFDNEDEPFLSVPLAANSATL